MKTYTALIASLLLAGASAAMAGDTNNASSALASLHPDSIEGKDIMNAAGEQLGDVDELVKNKSNQRMVVIGLEDSIKEVVVPLDKFTLSADGETLSTTLTRAELEALPDYDPLDMESVDE